MKTIKVQFTWTELLKLSDDHNTVRSIFKQVTTEVDDYTFEEIKEIHVRNYKAMGDVYAGLKTTNQGYLTDKWHDSSIRLHLDKLRQEVEKEDTVYIVELDYPWLRFAPMIIKTKKETV